MTAGVPPARATPLATLREYQSLGPWGLRELAALSGRMLEAAGVLPAGGEGRAAPSERTVRFYVAQGLVSRPEGRGTAATYSYRHLLQVLAVKLRQFEGASLAAIRRELEGLAVEVVERRVAAALGPALPPPARLPLGLSVGRAPSPTRRAPPADVGPTDAAPAATTCRRIAVAPGIELLVDQRHPALWLGHGGDVAEAVRRALGDRLTP